ncbi:MAG: SDR family NAD(P)-dependent oxidoreductase [Sedimentibacter sp.]
MQLFSLNDKNAVVIGGAGGLGQSIAQGLVEAGAKVMLASRSKESLERAAQEIKDNTKSSDVYYATVDATNEESINDLLDSAVEKFGQIHILINAQGFNKKFPAVDFDMDVFRQMFDINVVGLMLSCKCFGKHMMEHGYGKIVNLSSVRGKIATKAPGNAGYCSTKGAVDMLTKQLASEFGPYGITVNAIGPTLTETPMMTATIEQRGGDKYRNQVAEGLPMRRMAKPEDCVGTAVYLSAHASDFVTGNIIYPDGGLTAIG